MIFASETYTMNGDIHGRTIKPDKKLIVTHPNDSNDTENDDEWNPMEIEKLMSEDENSEYFYMV